MTTLNRALTANFLTSLLFGIILIFFQAQVAQLFGVTPHVVFPIIGAGLLLFALSIAIEIKKQRPLAIFWISAQDALWVITSAVVLVWQPWPISAAGYWIIDGVAMLVLLFCVLQIKGLAQINTRNGAKILTFKRVINAPQARVWEIITQFEEFHLVAPNIDAVEILSDQTQGTGMIRACSHGSKSWQETCTLWDEGKKYAFEVDTQAPDYPFPFAALRGTWELYPLNEQRTEILMEFEVTYKKKIHQALLHPIAQWQHRKTGETLLNNWQKMAEETEQLKVLK
ncbi:MAG TPA: hypothetical protein DCS93_23225 [Microscillaceae bacterium]|nr:hypothetical protein [Microscillaceae bacterium]